jgi:ATP-dependent Clp protease ATP-binding subunit ClpC
MIASSSNCTPNTGVIRVTEKQIQEKNSSLIYELDQHIYGMNEVKKAFTDILSKPKIPLIDSSTTPLGTIIIGWPTGIGKSEIVRALAEVLLGNPDALTHISCDTLQEPHSVSVLVGSPPSYVGYWEPTPFADSQLFKPYYESKQSGKLHELIRWRDGFAIVLMDEIEKAHPDVSQALLTALSKGEIKLRSGKETNTDSRNKIEHSTTTSLRNTLFVFTTNAWESLLADSQKRSLGFTPHETHDKNHKTAFKEALQRNFSREFLGRIEYKIRCESYTQEEKK